MNIFDGTATLDDVRKKIKLDTRHFAKRQLTWFRREKEVTMLELHEFDNKDKLLKYMLEMIKEKNII